MGRTYSTISLKIRTALALPFESRHFLIFFPELMKMEKNMSNMVENLNGEPAVA